MLEFLNDAHIWLVFSFLIFVGIVWKLGKDKFIAMLDGRIETIREEIKIAGNLRIEAQEMLAQYQRKHRDAVKDAEKIVETAEKQARDIKEKAERDLEETMSTKERQLEERLERLKQSAKDEIREYAASLALEAATEIIAANLNEQSNSVLVDDAIKQIGKNIH